MADDLADRATEALFGEGADRVCEDIPDSACNEQPANLRRHLASLSATKTGDGLADPKLVLVWLVSALGGSALAVGLIVPAREALALLPQLFVGHRVRAMSVRKWAWAAASAVQGAAVAAMGLVALTFDGGGAAWTIVALVAVFALARSVASASYKDVLGKTVSKSRRGTVTGTATSIAAAATLVFGLGLATGWIPLTTTSVGATLLLAGALWTLAAGLFAGLEETPGATEGGVDGVAAAIANLAILRTERQLRLFITARSLLTVTAISPPYVLALTASGGRSASSLGPFVIASGVATIIGGRLWGRLSDKSSRKVLLGSAAASSLLFAAAGAMVTIDRNLLSSVWVAGGLLFLVVLAYQGVRLGRSTHLVDMAAADERAVFTAVSNTVVGAALLVTGVFGTLQDGLGLGFVFLAFAAAPIAAMFTAYRLDEVQ
ncbi:MAG: hypothetical protein R2770_01730 [Acidimicrobiales bacterium]